MFSVEKKNDDSSQGTQKICHEKITKHQQQKSILKQQLKQAFFSSAKKILKSLRFTIWRRCVDSGFSVDFFFVSFFDSEQKIRRKKEIFLLLFMASESFDFGIFARGFSFFFAHFFVQFQRRKIEKVRNIYDEIIQRKISWEIQIWYF